MAAKAKRMANGRTRKNGAPGVVVVGVGNMGASHARAYDKIDGFELAGLCARRIVTRRIIKRTDLPTRWSNVPRFADYGEALETLKPDVVSINTWTPTPTTRSAPSRQARTAFPS
jgi:predicted dehydrogenase